MPSEHIQKAFTGKRNTILLFGVFRGDAVMTQHIDIYKNIHKALRYVMFEFSRLMAKHDIGSSDSLVVLQEHFNDLSAFLKEHGHHEDEFFHDALQDQFPDVYASLSKQHEKAEALWQSMESKKAILFSPKAINAAEWHRFYLDVNQFIASYLEHLHYEETVVLPLLWQATSQEELLHRLTAMLNKFSEGNRARSKKYCLLSCNSDELGEMGYL
jgi:hypothetical protein